MMAGGGGMAGGMAGGGGVLVYHSTGLGMPHTMAT